jgi:hypothetical protein
MFKRTFGAVFVCAGLLGSGTLLAHHSLSGVYDIRKSGELTGTVTKVEFTNPHGAMHVAVDNTDGSKTESILTTGSANTLQSLGFGRGGPNTVIEGDVVTIGYFPARNGKPLGFIRNITLPNAKTIEFDPE